MCGKGRPDSPVEKHFQERTVEPQISPLRCAPVEMTKGRLSWPGAEVREEQPTPGLSTTLRSGRDDKG
jgi:hypothetical protein